MQTHYGNKHARGAECRHLVELLQIEESHYRRLLRLAWRQNSYMKRQDVDRLQTNAEEWAYHLPRADAARIERERMVTSIAAKTGVTIPPGHISDLTNDVDPLVKSEMTETMRRLRGTAAALSRQNELNRALAEFCLDLAEEESKIFRHGVLADPAGCYDGDAKATSRGAGGFLVKQA